MQKKLAKIFQISMVQDIQQGYIQTIRNLSLKSVKINVPFKNIQLDDAISILEDASQIDTSILRKIDDNLCIRNGKYGPYIFYKTPRMKKPQFMKLAGFDDNFKTCKIEYLRAWIKEKYTI